MYNWKEFGGVDHLRDFQVTELGQNRDTGESVYQTFKVCSCIVILIHYSALLYFRSYVSFSHGRYPVLMEEAV